MANLLLSPPQRDLNTMEQINGSFGYDVVSPFSIDTPSPLLLNHNNQQIYGGCSSTTPTTADSFTYYGGGVTNLDSDCFFPRKRSRDSRFLHQNPRSSTTSTNTSPFSFLGQEIDISTHINQQQNEIDRFVSLHMERVRFEIEEKRKRQARTIMEAIEHGLVKRLRVKEEERERIWKINHALEERVKSLSVENQIWRDLAQSNEATANNLRTNLQQILAQVKVPDANVREEDDDAESCCGSSSAGEETVRRRMLVVNEEEAAYDKKVKGRMCRNCGEEESCVLLLPCRHLCLCGICGSSVHTCPICKSPKNASVHVNLSS
ncbi:hypothetical protein AALP_AA2G239300 [Arabis alpina]|uniref:RING-type E3 ubiquitin transferase n=1 Tax=Arabis alpina TaxID=50452 RepID=A0A087HJK8_ARAAL|nr:hypothetical protein AALP_AA2G239300 [Arabis alpina]